MARINQRLNGLNPLAYIGDNSYQPPEFVTYQRAPTPNDSQNFELGTIWLNLQSYPIPPTNSDIWMLVALVGGTATWVNFGGGMGDVISLTGNTGGPVLPTLGNINTVGDGVTITIAGNPGTSTLTASTVGTGVVSSLTGNSGGAVFPTAGNINVLGTGVISVAGNPGTSTLTVTPSGAIASSFITNPPTGTATPSAGVLTFAGTGDVTVSAAGSTVTINGGTSGTVTGLKSQDGNTVTPTAGVIQVSGGNNLTTTGTVGPNTLTVSLSGITQHDVQVGGAANSLTQIPNGTTGQVLTAVTGSDPIWQTNSSSYSTGAFTPVLRFGGASVGITYQKAKNSIDQFPKEGMVNKEL